MKQDRYLVFSTSFFGKNTDIKKCRISTNNFETANEEALRRVCFPFLNECSLVYDTYENKVIERYER